MRAKATVRPALALPLENDNKQNQCTVARHPQLSFNMVIIS